MSAEEQEAGSSEACWRCIRRGWLLAELSPLLDYACHDCMRLIELLALEDEELLRALGGRRRGELEDRYARLLPVQLPCAWDTPSICRHDRLYPAGLDGGADPHMLALTRSRRRFGELTAAPVVAILGSTRATDYGVQMARSIARGLGASGVTVATQMADGISAAAQSGGLEIAAGTLVAMDGGVDVAHPAKHRSLYERIARNGCALAELPCGARARRWGSVASRRTLVALAALTIVVEADDTPAELAGARLARLHGRTVAAVPGRVTSPFSRGTHALLRDGAPLVRGAGDVLELLYELGVADASCCSVPEPELEERLRATLELVGAGKDTAEQLTGEGRHAGEVLAALSELELIGLLARGDGGRYVLCDGLPPP